MKKFKPYQKQKQQRAYRKALSIVSLFAFICVSSVYFAYWYETKDAQASVNWVRPAKERTLKLYTKEEAIDRIKVIAAERDFAYTDYLLRLVACETGGTFDQFALNWKNANGTLDSGALQINSVHKIGRDKTFDLDWSVNFAIDRINEGKQTMWVCNSLVKTNPDKYRKFYN